MTPDPKLALPTYDCLVLSGGGAKGAYGAGVAKALWEFRRIQKSTTQLCVVGTSAGALNAAVLATADANDLISFWTSTSNRKVLGVWISRALVRGPAVAAFRWLFRRSAPFSIYPNKALRRLVTTSIRYAGPEAQRRPLILAATNYTTGTLAGFYSSPLVGQLIAWELSNLPAKEYRLQHLVGLANKEDFYNALLASSAIPVAFPPVEIAGSLYIDGGVGNNTPTREAAYFLRRLERSKLGCKGEVFCVTQEMERTLIEGTPKLGFGDIIRRSVDVYHTVHTRPIIAAWDRINGDVQDHLVKLDATKKAIAAMIPDPVTAAKVCDVIDSDLQPKQQEIRMTFIEPSTDLGRHSISAQRGSRPRFGKATPTS